MRLFLLILVATLAAVGPLAAETNSVVVGAAAAPAPADPASVEAAFKQLLAADNAAQAEADRWVQDNAKFTAQGGGMDKEQLRLKLLARFEPVQKSYEEFLKAHPDYVPALLAHGSLLNDLNDEDGAAAQWERARKLAPTNSATWNNLGNHYAANGEYKKAFEYFERAVALAPKVATYRQNLGSAIVHFRTNAMAYYELGEQAVLDKGLRFLREAQHLEPDNFPLATDIGQVYYGLHPPRTDEAIEAWEVAQKLAADDIERDGTRLHLARVNFLAGRFAEARRQLGLIHYDGYTELKQKLATQITEAETAAAAKTNAPPAPAATH